jgi:hypothetical protein
MNQQWEQIFLLGFSTNTQIIHPPFQLVRWQQNYYLNVTQTKNLSILQHKQDFSSPWMSINTPYKTTFLLFKLQILHVLVELGHLIKQQF